MTKPLYFCQGILICILAASATRAESGDSRTFNIPAGEAENTLKLFSEQSDRGLIIEAAVAEGVRTGALHGDFIPQQAIEQLLKGTGLTASEDAESGDFVVHRENARPKALRPAPMTAGQETKAGPTRDQDSVRTKSRAPKPTLPTFEEVLVLDPFQVNLPQEASYGALNSNSITRFNVELANTPMSADVFNRTFIQDIGSTSVTDMLEQYGAGIGYVYASAGASSAGSQPGDRVLYSDRFTPIPLGGRGLSDGYIQQDGFQKFQTNMSSMSNFDVDRVEVLHGPQALLYGAGGAGGTIEVTSKQAVFGQQSGTIAETVDKFGSKRALADIDAGGPRIALRIASLREDNQQRRLFIDDLTEGYYGQLAVILPFNSILRVNGEYTTDHRIDPTAPTVDFGANAADPRQGDNLGYLVATHQTGAIDDGHLSFSTINSFGGWRMEDIVKDFNYTANLDTVWNPWLSTNFGANLNRQFFYTGGMISNLTAPLASGNPFADWAMNSNLTDTTNTKKRKQYQGSALLTKAFFNGTVNTQTVLGAERSWSASGVDDFGYFLSDAQGHAVIDPGNPNNLGRTPLPIQWWSVGGGPVKQPLAAPLAPVVFFNGNYYARMEQNPQSPQWITPNNPLGNAALYPGFNDANGNSTVSGLQTSPFGKQYLTVAYYAGNYTSWWNDFFTTLIGIRNTKISNHVANGSAEIGSTDGSVGYDNSQRKNTAYNFGVDGRITTWLRWYADASSTYDNSVGFDDPYGAPPTVSQSTGQEAGFKFKIAGGRASGSLDYYQTIATGQNFGLGPSSYLNLINPAGLNGVYNGADGRDAWVPMNQRSDGAELMLTAAPTKNWRLRLAATDSNGKVNQTKSYGILYNDEFYADPAGGVTYKDGSPFLVPVNPGPAVATLSGPVNPASINAGVATEQLTTAMIGSADSPYYAWGQGNQPAANGQINAASNVGKVLSYFNSPGRGTALTGRTGLAISAIQYAWPDPENTHGTITVFRAGQVTTGYPVYSANLTSTYEFTQGWLRGVGLVTSLNGQWNWRTYYYSTPAGDTYLYSQPSIGVQLNVHPYYQHKFRRFLWRTQIDVTNLANHYTVSLTPDPKTGFSNAANVGFRFNGYPRTMAWTNSFNF